MANFTKIFVYLERHATTLVEKYPTLIKTVTPIALQGGGVAYMVTHPRNDRGVLDAAKKHLDDNRHGHATGN